MIWFVVSVIITISLIGVFIGIAYQYSDTIQRNARGEAANYYVNADIINDPVHMLYDENNDNLTIYVKNTGRYEIYKRHTLVGLNGETYSVNESDINIMGDESSWRRGAVARINISAESLNFQGDNYVWVEVQGIYQGSIMGRDRDSLDFYFDS